jgi:copper chaperone
MTTSTYKVEGMTCGHCKQSVETSLAGLAGVTAATADVEAGTVAVEGDVDDDAVTAAISDAGYEVAGKL